MSVDITDLIEAVDTLGTLVDQMAGFHEGHPLAAAAAQQSVLLTMARLHLAEHARARAEGKSDDEAMFAALRGDRPFTPEEVAAIEEGQKRLVN